MTKILTAKAERDAKQTFSPISNEKLLAIYAAMVKCRMLEQRASTLFQQGRLDSDFHGSAGREAPAAAVVIDLQPDDALSIVPGDWLPAFVKGMSLESLFHMLAPDARQDGLGPAEPGQQNLVLPWENANPSETVRERAATALVEKKGAIVAVFLAPGPESLKTWQKTMAAAASQKLPIVFVHHVDQISARVDQQGKRPGNPEAHFQGVPTIAVDALDPVAVYRVAYEAIVRARQGRGASLLQCTVHPAISGTSTTNNEGQSGRETTVCDPVIAMESYLKRKGIEPELHNRAIVEGFNHDLDLATRFLDR